MSLDFNSADVLFVTLKLTVDNSVSKLTFDHAINCATRLEKSTLLQLVLQQNMEANDPAFLGSKLSTNRYTFNFI